ncbi:MAG: tail fiber domain-containing protein [Phycisphaerae bacterium]
MRKSSVTLCMLLPLCIALPLVAETPTETFTFQGVLTETGAPDANGSYLLEFRLFATLEGGAPLEVLTDIPVTLSDGLFTTQLTFTVPTAFDGSDRYIETAVRESPSDSYQTLAPRMPVTSTPYAIRSAVAADANTLDGRSAAGFIQNSTTAQLDANFNISGNGTVGGVLLASGVSVGINGITMNNALLRLLDLSNPNHGIRYSPTVDGPEFRGFAGFIWRNGTNGATERMRLDGSGNLTATGSIGAATQFNLGGERFVSRAGNLNTFVGSAAGNVNVGQQNTFVGSRSGQNNLSGLRNTFLGDASGAATINANECTYIGALAGLNATGTQNTMIGAGAGQNTTTGAGNTFVGFVAGNNNTTGSFITAIGYNATAAANVTNSVAIGAGARAETSNTIVLGTEQERVVIPALRSSRSTLCIDGNGEVGVCTSSLRYKTNIAPFLGGMALVNQLQPITFDWKSDGENDFGLGAEDVARIEPLLVTHNRDGLVEGVKYDRLPIVLVNALKEQQAQIDVLQRQLDKQQQIIETLTAGLRENQTKADSSR